MNKLEAIQHHQALVIKRKDLSRVHKEIPSEMTKQLLKEIDSLIGRYGNVHNPKIAIKAAQYIGL